MSQTEQITIKQIGRKQAPSKFKPGETFSITNVMDDKGRKLTGMGPWTENWKEGDVIQAVVEEKKWTDKDGFEQTGLNLKNPNQTPFVPRAGGGGNFNPTLTLYQIAAQLAPLLFANKKQVKLEDIEKLVEALKEKTNVATPVEEKKAEPVKTTTPDVNIDEEDDLDEDDLDDEEVPF